MKSILGIGNAITDIILTNNSEGLFPAENTTSHINSEEGRRILERIPAAEALFIPGGAAANTICCAAALGMKGSFIGKVGADSLGERFVRNMDEMSIDVRIQQSDSLSGFSIIGKTKESTTPRIMAVHRGEPVCLKSEDFLLSDGKPFDFIYIEGYLAHNQVLMSNAVSMAKKTGAKICLDLCSAFLVKNNLQYFRELVKENVDILFANEDETKAFSGCEKAEEGIETISSLCRIAALKLGAKGSIVLQGDTTFRINAIPGEALDPTGAGDAYSAGFLFGLSRGYPLDICGHLGSVISSKVIESYGPKISGSAVLEVLSEIDKITRQSGL